jgi:hypothetical protein
MKTSDKSSLESDEPTAGFQRIAHIVKQMSVEDNIPSAFLHLGFQYDIDASPYGLIFDEHVLRQGTESSSFWPERTLLRSDYREDETSQLAESPGSCAPCAMAEGKLPSAGSGVIIQVYFTS